MVNWKIVELERQSNNGLVLVAHWEATLSEDVATQENTKQTLSSRIYGSISLEKGKTFIEFKDLTEAMVIDWVKNKLGEEEVSRYESALQNSIEEQKMPPVLKGVPWTGDSTDKPQSVSQEIEEE